MAPEILQREEETDFAVDMWSVGVVFVEILSGKMLLGSHRDQTESILTGITKMEENLEPFLKELIPTMTSAEQALLHGLLQTDPKKRTTAKEALQNSYFDSIAC